MSLSRNLWSVLLVAATSAVGTLVLVLNRDLQGERELVLTWQDPTPVRVLAWGICAMYE